MASKGLYDTEQCFALIASQSLPLICHIIDAGILIR